MLFEFENKLNQFKSNVGYSLVFYVQNFQNNENLNIKVIYQWKNGSMTQPSLIKTIQVSDYLAPGSKCYKSEIETTKADDAIKKLYHHLKKYVTHIQLVDLNQTAVGDTWSELNQKRQQYLTSLKPNQVYIS